MHTHLRSHGQKKIIAQRETTLPGETELPTIQLGASEQARPRSLVLIDLSLVLVKLVMVISHTCSIEQ